MANEDRTVTVHLRARIRDYESNADRATRKTRGLNAEAERFDGSEFTASLDIDAREAHQALAGVKREAEDFDGSRYEGRVRLPGTDQASRNMSNLIGLSLSLGPALVPVTAAASAGMLALGTSAGIAATSAGTAALAFAGLGDALSALNQASLDPTEANVEALQQAMEGLSAEGQRFVEFLHGLKPELDELRATAQAGLLPGVAAGIEELTELLPQLDQLVDNSATALGELAESGADALTDPYWRNFISFVSSEAGPTLESFGQVLGNLAEGFTGALMAFNPMANDVEQGLENLTGDFREWGTTLSANEGFRDFVGYVRQVTPQTLDTLGSVAGAVGSVVEAAAPVGPVVLQGIESLADVLNTIASIPGLGTGLVAAATGLGALNTAIRAYDAVKSLRILEVMRGYGPSGRRAAGGLSRMAGRLGAVGLAIGPVLAGLDQLEKKMLGLPASQDNLVAALTAIGTNAPNAAETVDNLNVELGRYSDAVQTLLNTPDWMEAANWVDEIGPAATNVGQAEEALRKLDTALTTMVESGRAQAAADIVGQVGLNSRQASRYLPGYTQALARNEVEAGTAAGQQQRLGQSTGQAASEMSQAETAARRFRLELANLTTGALSADEAAIAYERAVDQLNQSIEENGRATDIATQAGRANRTALIDQTQAAAGHIQAMVEDDRATSSVARQTRQYRKDLVDAAVQMGYSREEAQKLIGKYLDVPDNIDTFVNTPGLQKAINKTDALASMLGGLEGTYKFAVVNPLGGYGGGLSGGAGGGQVQGAGSGTSDSNVIRASTGEWVIRESSSREQGPQRMAALNSGQADIVPRYAEGGRVTPQIVGRYSSAGLGAANRLFGALEPFSGGAGLAFARAQAGEPYVWGGTGPHGWDCSGYMSGIAGALTGGDPGVRRFSTHSFAGGRGAGGFRRGLSSPFMIGVDPGSHMAGTIAGVNVESSGSAGVRVGGGARGAAHGMFPYQFGFTGVSDQAASQALANEGILADRGSLVPHGGWAANLSGQTEAVLTGPQWRAVARLAAAAERSAARVDDPGSAAAVGGPGGNTYVLQQSVTEPGASAAEVADETLFAFRAQLRDL